jgi:hypothetical protein
MQGPGMLVTAQTVRMRLVYEEGRPEGFFVFLWAYPSCSYSYSLVRIYLFLCLSTWMKIVNLGVKEP